MPCIAFAEYNRIISLSPSLTEILYALDVQDKIVGVTKYCKFPPQAQDKTIVGGMLDPNFEVIYSLEPDLILYHKGTTGQQDRLKQLGIDVLETESRSVKGILESIQLIGDKIQRQKQSKELLGKIKKKIKAVKAQGKGKEKPRVLLTYFRPIATGDIREVYIAGNHTYFNDLIELAGGVNAFQGSKSITSPVVSAEGILEMDPDVIIEIKGTIKATQHTKEEMLRDWESLSFLKAYQNHRIYILTEEYIGIPGPRLVLTLMDMAECIHPEIKWE